MQLAPLQPLEDPGGADINPAACGVPHSQAGGYAPKETAACRQLMQEQAPSKYCGLWRGVFSRACFSNFFIHPFKKLDFFYFTNNTWLSIIFDKMFAVCSYT